MIIIQSGITVGPGIIIGIHPTSGVEIDFVTEDQIYLISEAGLQFIEDNT